MDHLVPGRLASVLRGAGLRPAGPLGARGTPLWSAVDPDGGRWAVIEVPAQRAAAARQRAALLASIEHPTLAQAGPVLDAPDGDVVMLVAADPGTDLELVAAARGPLGDGEAVGVLVPVAEALEAMHAAGLAHGALGASQVVLTTAGPVLVDVGGGPAPMAEGPLLTRLQAEDSAALLALGIRLAGGAGPVADAVAPGLPPGELARRWAGVAAPSRVALPDPAVLARLGLRRLADLDPGALRPGSSDAAGRGGPRRRAARAGRQGPLGARGLPAQRVRRAVRAVRAPRAVRAVAVAAGLALGLGALGGAGAAMLAGRAGPPLVVQSPSERGARGPAVVALVAAVRLSEQRARGLAAGDRAALLALTEPGSPAAMLDRALVLSPVPLAAVHATAEPGAVPGCPPGLVCVPVSTVVRTPAGAASTGRVVLALRPGTWRVVEVTAG